MGAGTDRRRRRVGRILIIVIAVGGSSRRPARAAAPVSRSRSGGPPPSTPRPRRPLRPAARPAGGPSAGPARACRRAVRGQRQPAVQRARTAAGKIAAQLHALRATGVTLARSDAFWEASEPSAPVAARHHYVWSFDDQIATALATAGLRWLPVLDYTAPWDQSIPGQDHSPPRSDADYAAYARPLPPAMAGGAFWRLHPGVAPPARRHVSRSGTSPITRVLAPAPDAAAYALLYPDARAAIDAVDPGARVIIGGLTNSASVHAGHAERRTPAAGHIDGVGIHPYGTPAVVLARVGPPAPRCRPGAGERAAVRDRVRLDDAPAGRA